MLAVQTQPNLPKPAFKPIIEASALPQVTKGMPEKFNAKKHLAFSPPEEIIRMTDIGYPEDTGVSPVAVSQPFQLFSKEAVEQMRAEIFSPTVMENCGYRSNIAALQLRGYCPQYAPFAYDAWTSPETLAILSKIAGVELVPAMNYDIGHINVSVKSDEQTREERAEIETQKRFFAEDEGIAGCPWEDDKPVVGWHTDSYPFVCVLMLSDCTDMVGGETALRTADGNVLKVRGPEMGCAVVMQGRYITHQALRALGTKERITSVTSFRPKSAHLADDTVLTTVRPISDLSELYYDFGEYRLEIMEERIRSKLHELKANRRAGKRIQTADFKKFLEQQTAFLKHTNGEIVEEDKVQVGYIDEMRFPDVKVGADDEPPKRVAKRPRME